MTFSKDDPFERQGAALEIVPCDALPLREQRSVMFQLLYAIDAADYTISLDEIVHNFCAGFSCSLHQHGLILHRVRAVVESRDALDDVIKPLLHNWRFERLSVATKLILRLALWELMYTDLDISVVMNEAVELAKSFAEHDAHKFVNGILDEWVHKHRPEKAAALQPLPEE